MKRCLPILFALCCLVTSCTMRPKWVLSNSEMVDLLVDLHYAEAVIQSAGYNYGHDDEVNRYYATLLEERGVTQAQLDSSLAWYTAHPQYFQSVYPRVMQRLEKQQLAQQAQANSLAANELIRKNLSPVEKNLRSDLLQPASFEEYLQQSVHGVLIHLYSLPKQPLCTDSIYEQLHSKTSEVSVLPTDSLVQ